MHVFCGIFLFSLLTPFSRSRYCSRTRSFYNIFSVSYRARMRAAEHVWDAERVVTGKLDVSCKWYDKSIVLTDFSSYTFIMNTCHMSHMPFPHRFLTFSLSLFLTLFHFPNQAFRSLFSNFPFNLSFSVRFLPFYSFVPHWSDCCAVLIPRFILTITKGEQALMLLYFVAVSFNVSVLFVQHSVICCVLFAICTAILILWVFIFIYLILALEISHTYQTPKKYHQSDIVSWHGWCTESRCHNRQKERTRVSQAPQRVKNKQTHQHTHKHTHTHEKSGMQQERHTPKKNKCQSKNESENWASRTKQEENENTNRQNNVNILNGVYYMYVR